MKRILTLLLLLAAIAKLEAQTFKVDTIQFSGNEQNRVNVVVLADGYTSSDLSHYKSDVQAMMNAFWAADPWKEYKNYINVFAIEVVSQQSGAKHPGTASDCGSYGVPVSNPTNYFGSSFDAGGIHRLLVPGNQTAVSNVLAANFPNYDQVIMIVNTPYYGGSGGAYATTSLDASSKEIALHETSHSFAGTADEYYAGAQYMTEKPNLTQDNNSATNRWTKWLGYTGPSGLTGMYPHTGNSAWFKPTTGGKCRMEVLGKPFCNVCMEAHIEKIHNRVKPYDSYLPASSPVGISTMPLPFSLQLVKPISNTLKTSWTLDGNAYASLKDSVSVNPAGLALGMHTLNVSIIDTTYLVRVPSHFTAHIYNVQWQINKTLTGIAVNSSEEKITVSVFPNPASDRLTVSFTLEKPCQAAIALYTLQGKLVFEMPPSPVQAGKQDMQIPVAQLGLPSGTYALRMKLGSTELSRQVIIE